MAKHNVVFTKDNEYYTPKEFVRQFGVFDYDPATTKEKATEFGIKDYDTIKTDGLQSNWGGYIKEYGSTHHSLLNINFLRKQ